MIRRGGEFLLIVLSLLARGEASAPQASRPVFFAREISSAGEAAPPIYFARPVAMAFDRAHIFVLDAQDCEIKVFLKSGAFVSSFGRKGQGPGEFHSPSDLDILDETVYVADGGNRRVQAVTKTGRYLGGFNTGFFPWRILALDSEHIVVVPLPSGRAGGRKVLHCFSSRGEEIWATLDARSSNDSVLETMENQIFIRKAGLGEFYALRTINERFIRRLDSKGLVTAEIEVGPDYPFKEISIPALKGPEKTVRGLCWNLAADGESLYLLLPELTEDQDLGPGRRLAVLTPAGRISAFIDLPDKVIRFAVDGNRIAAVDLDYRLRLFSVEKK